MESGHRFHGRYRRECRAGCCILSAIIQPPRGDTMNTNEKTAGRRPGITARLLEILEPAGVGVRIREVRIGLGYTAVQLDDGRTGLAYTFHEEAGEGCTLFHAFRPLAGRQAADLLPLIGSANRIEAAVGLACANAMTNQPDPACREDDILEHLDLTAQDWVAMIGCFTPLIDGIKKRVHTLTVFERKESANEHIRPADEVWDGLPRCQVALITATAILNRTIDRLLEASAHCRVVAILGASTPLLPAVFAGTPVNVLSGVVVRDPQGILQVVSEAGGMHFFRDHIRKVNRHFSPLPPP